MLVYIEAGCGACLRLGKSVETVARQVLREVGTTNGVQVAKKATQREISWVTGMGGYNPAAKIKP
jgi:hypothetical protein